MADTLRRRWTLEEFFAWEESQEGRHEFVDGVVRAMVGGTRRHNKIAANILTHLTTALRGKKCQAYGSDMKIVTLSGNVRYPDVTVDCGSMNPDDVAATEPSVVVEVLSKSTAWADQTHKLDEYQAIQSIQYILHLAQERAEGELWSRKKDTWSRTPLRGLNAEVDFGAIRVNLQLAVAYDGVAFDPEPAPQNDNGDPPA